MLLTSRNNKSSAADVILDQYNSNDLFGTDSILTLHIKKLGYYVLKIHMAFCRYALGDDLIDYHPYDGRLDSDTSREINPTNIERIEKVCEGRTRSVLFLWAIPSEVITRRKISSSTLIN